MYSDFLLRGRRKDNKGFATGGKGELQSAEREESS